jgi:hypothetical protein
LRCEECKGCLKEVIFEIARKHGAVHQRRMRFIKPKKGVT